MYSKPAQEGKRDVKKWSCIEDGSFAAFRLFTGMGNYHIRTHERIERQKLQEKQWRPEVFGDSDNQRDQSKQSVVENSAGKVKKRHNYSYLRSISRLLCVVSRHRKRHKNAVHRRERGRPIDRMMLSVKKSKNRW